MRSVVFATGSICNLWVVVNGMFQLYTGCKCNEIADKGVVDAHPCFFHFDDVPNDPAGVNHGILMGLL